MTSRDWVGGGPPGQGWAWCCARRGQSETGLGAALRRPARSRGPGRQPLPSRQRASPGARESELLAPTLVVRILSDGQWGEFSFPEGWMRQEVTARVQENLSGAECGPPADLLNPAWPPALGPGQASCARMSGGWWGGGCAPAEEEGPERYSGPRSWPAGHGGAVRPHLGLCLAPSSPNAPFLKPLGTLSPHPACFHSHCTLRAGSTQMVPDPPRPPCPAPGPTGSACDARPRLPSRSPQQAPPPPTLAPNDRSRCSTSCPGPVRGDAGGGEI